VSIVSHMGDVPVAGYQTFWTNKRSTLRGITSSTPTCCDCRLAEGEKIHPANYRGCRHAKEEMQKKKSQRTPRITTGRLFPCDLITPGVSFTAALLSRTEEQQQPQTHQLAVAGPAATPTRTADNRLVSSSP
jgi:hypothetical protein